MDPKFPMQQFTDHLLRDQGRALTTAATYTNVLKGFFRDPENANALLADPDRLASYAITFDAELRPTSKAVFRSALRAFMKWANQKGLPVTAPVFPDGRHVRWEKERDAENAVVAPLAPLLRALEDCRVPFKRVPLIRWRDVTGGAMGMPCHVEDVAASTVYLVPKPTILALGMWAGGGKAPEKSLPMVPSEPLGKSPMQTKRLMRIARL
jgi:integrase family protein with SAM-like domain